MFRFPLLFAASILCVVPGLLPAQTQGGAMPHEKIDTPFYVAGYLVRTNNSDEASGESKIGPLWQRFKQENLVARIPNRADADLTVVYSNYASDENGNYDYLLGARVNSIHHLPAGMTWKRVEPATYAVILRTKARCPASCRRRGTASGICHLRELGWHDARSSPITRSTTSAPRIRRKSQVEILSVVASLLVESHTLIAHALRAAVCSCGHAAVLPVAGHNSRRQHLRQQLRLASPGA